MHDGAPRALERLVTACDQRFARLRQCLDGDILGHQILFDQLAHKIEVGLRCRRKADFDFLEADVDQ